MPRPREFDETAALDAAIECFWRRGYEATSLRDLTAAMGLTAPSLYNAFGDKEELFALALERYLDRNTRGRLRRLEETLAPSRQSHDFSPRSSSTRSTIDSAKAVSWSIRRWRSRRIMPNAAPSLPGSFRASRASSQGAFSRPKPKARSRSISTRTMSPSSF